MKEKKERFIELLCSTGREGMESVINYLENSAFFTSPASTAYHMSYEGGLMDHSMNVYEMAMALRGPIVAMKPGVGEWLSEKSIIKLFRDASRPWREIPGHPFEPWFEIVGR